MTRGVLAAAALVACAATARAADAPGPLFLVSIPVDAPPRLALDGPLAATLELHPDGAAKVETAREWFRGAVARDGAVTLRLDEAAPGSRPGEAQRRPTFFVDADQPAVVALRAEVVKAYGATPTPADLARFVDGWITKKSMGRLLDDASTVARRREGDCTEHAVLLAAVARLFGRASRVVLGVALVRGEGRILALGHAWAEIEDGGRWHTADAAMVGLPAPVRHVPLGALADEGPAYASAAWRQLSPLDVKRVVLRAVP